MNRPTPRDYRKVKSYKKSERSLAKSKRIITIILYNKENITLEDMEIMSP